VKDKLVILAIGLGIVAAMAAAILYLNRGSHIQLKGEIQKVRLQEMDDNSTVVVADFRFVNPASYPFVVRKVDMFVETLEGDELDGKEVSEPDARRLFDYYKLLGPKYNDTFTIREKVAPQQSMDRMLAARFEVPASRIEQRKRLRIRVEDVDGAVSELVQEQP
jgi:hypothetical protein